MKRNEGQDAHIKCEEKGSINETRMRKRKFGKEWGKRLFDTSVMSYVVEIWG